MNELLEKNGWELFLPKKNAIIDLFYFEHNLSAADLFILQKWVLCIVYALSCFYFVLLMLKIYFMWILNVMEGGLIFPPSPAKLVNLRKKWTMQVQPSYFFFQGIWKKKNKTFLLLRKWLCLCKWIHSKRRWLHFLWSGNHQFYYFCKLFLCWAEGVFFRPNNLSILSK